MSKKVTPKQVPTSIPKEHNVVRGKIKGQVPKMENPPPPPPKKN